MKCANHPLNDGVSYCGQCGRALCTECKREVGGMVYCENCLVTRVRGPLPPWGTGPGGTSPGVALALGFLPGVGAIYNGQITKAIAQVLIFGSLIGLGERVHGGLDAIFHVASFAFYAYMVIDSYQTARAMCLGKPVPDWFGLTDFKLNAPIGASILIGLGVLFLLDNLGYPVFSHISKWWPVLLILAGVLLLQHRHAGGSARLPPPMPPPENPPAGPSNLPGAREL